MPPRPSSGQSDGVMHASVNMPGMGQDRGNLERKCCTSQGYEALLISLMSLILSS